MTEIYMDLMESSWQQEELNHARSDGFVVSAGEIVAGQIGLFSQSGVKLLVKVDKDDDQTVVNLAANAKDALCFVCDAGLTETDRMRALAPDSQWIAKTDVYKVSPSFSFSSDEYTSGFKTYKMDPATIDERRVRDGNLLLEDWVDRARYLNFDLIWLDSSEAHGVGKGFDLIAARRAAKAMSGGVLISGGATTFNHVRNLANECMVRGVVLEEALINEVGADTLREIWRPVAGAMQSSSINPNEGARPLSASERL